MSARPIYVERRMRCSMDDLWARTQDPLVHARWDLRFTEIDYLPRPDEAEPQRFRYATTVAPGVTVAGTGETIGERTRADGTRTSFLRFGSADRRSLIDEGAGYWRYVPTDDGIRFLTRYDYRARWGAPGRAADRAFRPLMGWATAWSFDRLGLWLEEGVSPERSLATGLTHAIAVAGLAGCWAYQGVVPKLLVRDSGELDILRRSGAVPGREELVLSAVGLAELAFGVATIARSRRRWPFVANLVALPLLALGGAKADRSLFTKPFNPASLTLAMAALSAIALLARRAAPSAGACLRRPPVPGEPDPEPEERP